MLARLGRHDDALASFDQALERAPSDEPAVRGRIDALVALGRRTEAAETLDRLSAELDAQGRLAEACDAAVEALVLAESRDRRGDVEAYAKRLRSEGRDMASTTALGRALEILGRCGATHRATASPSARRRTECRRPRVEREAATEAAAPTAWPAAVHVDLLAAAERALDGDDLDAIRTAVLTAAAAQRRDGQLEAALDTCYMALARIPADPDIHLALAGLYLDRGWRVSAVDKIILLGRLADLTGGRRHPRSAGDARRRAAQGRAAPRRPVRMTAPVLTLGAPGIARGAMLHSEAMPELLRSILEQVRLTTVLDIGLTALLIYWLFSLIRGTRAVRLVIGVSVLFIVYVLAVALDLRLLTRILQAGAVVGLFALVVVFQPELRRALERIGRVGSFGWLWSPAESRAVGHVAAEVAKAAAGLSADGHGALIVLERETGLEEVAETGVMIHGDVSADLLRTIFAPRTALHDGAVVIRGETIVAAGATLPLADTTVHTERFGTRHRAALGIAEQTDADRHRRLRGERPGQPGRAHPDRAQPERAAAGPGHPHAARSGPRAPVRFVWRPGGDAAGTAGRAPRLRDLGRGRSSRRPSRARPPRGCRQLRETPVATPG